MLIQPLHTSYLKLTLQTGDVTNEKPAEISSDKYYLLKVILIV